MFINAICKTKT